MASEEFDCIFCLESKSEMNPHEVGNYKICVDCAKLQIVPQFEKAAEHEFHYPPKCAGVVIDMLSFWDIVPNELFVRHSFKEEEYNTKVSERIYCDHTILQTEADDTAPLNANDIVAVESKLERCNAFLGSKCDISNESNTLHCHRCTGLICLQQSGNSGSTTEARGGAS